MRNGSSIGQRPAHRVQPKGFDGLHGIVRDRLGLEVRTGHLFLFANARRKQTQDFILGRHGPMELHKKVKK